MTAARRPSSGTDADSGGPLRSTAGRTRRGRPEWLGSPAVAGVCAVVLAATAACAGDPAPPAAPLVTRTPSPTAQITPLTRDAAVLLRVTDDSGLVEQLGTADIDTSVVSRDGGTITAVPGWDDGSALSFPPFTTAAEYPRAVLRVDNATDLDQMNPEAQDFSWGADFRINRKSFGSSMDNGDNLVQRGISTYPVFFKAELDGDRPACTVRGDAGEVFINSYQGVEPNTWYRMLCQRSGNQLSVIVTQISLGGGGATVINRRSGRIGRVDYPDADTPLAIGGKIGEDGEILQDASDQFNGQVMNPLLVIGAQSSP